MSKTKRLLVKVALFLAAGVTVLLIFGTYFIEKKVQGVCETAVKLHPGDKIEAVISMAQREDITAKERATTLWALGQLGDGKALNFLRSHYGDKSDDDICAYEAQFAIKKLEEDRFNLPGFLWRNLLSE